MNDDKHELRRTANEGWTLTNCRNGMVMAFTNLEDLCAGLEGLEMQALDAENTRRGEGRHRGYFHKPEETIFPIASLNHHLWQEMYAEKEEGTDQ